MTALLSQETLNLPIHFNAQSDYLRAFQKDALDMFLRRQQGHMERWEYFPADYQDDPAGGSAFWDALIKAPGDYYVPTADRQMIVQSLQDPNVLQALKKADTIVELGPGSLESIAQKTLPFLKFAKQYIAVDQSQEQADQAVDFVHAQTGIKAQAVISDYHSPELDDIDRGITAFIMWGVAIGNIEGGFGSDPTSRLTKVFQTFRKNCKQGDMYFVGNDTEQDASKVLASYHEPMLSKKFLSILYALDKFGLVAGNFNPAVWRHKSVWNAKTSQCAHCLYPIIPQDFEIMGVKITASAGEMFVENNSYKLKPETMIRAAKTAGFRDVTLTPNRPMTMCMAVA